LKNRFVITECTLFEPKLIVRQLENGDWLIPLAPAPARAPEAWKETSPSIAEESSFEIGFCESVKSRTGGYPTQLPIYQLQAVS
jgi:hypothetical protein